MPISSFRSNRRTDPYDIVMTPGERRRLAFFTDAWSGSTPSSPVLYIFDSSGADVTATYTSDTYSSSGDSESAVFGSNVIWTRYITGLVDGQSYKFRVNFTAGGNELSCYGQIHCQQFGNRLAEVKESQWVGVDEKPRYKLDTRPWRMPDDIVSALGIDNTVTSPVLTVYDLDGVDVTSSVTTDDSGTAPTEVSDYWVRTKFFDDLNPQEYNFIIKFVLNRNTHEAWGRLYGEDI